MATNPTWCSVPAIHALGRLPTGLGPVDGEQPWLLQLCNDRRGIWLTVADELRGVHVNGRPVRHVAMLRAGDSIHVDGSELLLIAANDDRTPPPAGARARPDRQPAPGPARAGRRPTTVAASAWRSRAGSAAPATPTSASKAPASPSAMPWSKR